MSRPNGVGTSRQGSCEARREGKRRVRVCCRRGTTVVWVRFT